MEGVVVSAKKNGSTIAISVISDATGNFIFPDAKLEPGKYTLASARSASSLMVRRRSMLPKPAPPVAIKLKKAGNLANQLTSGEWMASFPGTPQQKHFMDRCTSCHTYERIAKSSYNADEWIAVLQRMASYAPGPTRPSRRSARKSGNAPS